MKTKTKTLNDLLLDRGLGPQEAAARAGVGRSSLWRWATGTAWPRNDQLAALAKALDVDTTTIVEALAGSRERAERRARRRRAKARR